VKYDEALALLAAPPVRFMRETPKPFPVITDSGPTRHDLQNQIRELTNANLELRERLDEQARRVKELTDETNRLRYEVEQNRPAKSAPRKSPLP
jgi:predicted RNase H-like nuclease (RuvC/YqgF family)